MLARPVIFESVMLIVPVLPRTWSCAPCHVSSPASVTTNEGIPNVVNSAPCRRPIAVPTTMPATIAR